MKRRGFFKTIAAAFGSAGLAARVDGAPSCFDAPEARARFRAMWESAYSGTGIYESVAKELEPLSEVRARRLAAELLERYS